jgi:NTP pyrophosphatase (non-canonical NTP hydrolase)
MNFNEYQEKSLTTAMYPEIGNNPYYPTMGLVGEAGEIANKVKKIMRDKNGVIDEETKTDIKKELGDVLWYVAVTAKEFDLDMDTIAQTNIEKLAKRKEHGTITGSGDNR